MENAFVVKGLRKTYGDLVALDNLNLEVRKGEVFGLLGHNGAGKSTAIECILGTKIPDSGTVEVLKMDPIKDRKELFQKVGVQFQQTHYQDKIRVHEICEMTHSLYKNPADWKELLEIFNLDKENMKKQVSDLSGGERQKLSVVLALIPNPELVFLDELTTGLDPKARREVWNYLKNLKSQGLTIFLTSHYMDEVQTLCDRICILRKGKVVAMDTVSSVIETSNHSNLEDAYLWYTGEEDLGA
ncbi:ABC transporter ATP-binding protein [Acetivibrio mesophilus]|uniref:ABC transporter ATP-binding protein n=1 Tax=Acetivibrio mesophilus TaxID=2487273 RepID=A0A4Q0I8B3_9FIRM|nr:ABC transporter ATP-binding protein [Acetivibrio mesophilus]ODM26256.1 ABC transporter [Clostridium sp. Bc-iso-3]RXE60691.1 ABC transporter ATP-binding protein [Acetivibrio mesophilus]HHV28104.1 ABC transporter ATP-binding protein [Clostridium sp.]